MAASFQPSWIQSDLIITLTPTLTLTVGVAASGPDGSNPISKWNFRNEYTDTKSVKMRYRDDRIVTQKGEKTIVERLPVEDPATFITLKVKHKGRQKAMDGKPPERTGPRTK